MQSQPKVSGHRRDILLSLLGSDKCEWCENWGIFQRQGNYLKEVLNSHCMTLSGQGARRKEGAEMIFNCVKKRLSIPRLAEQQLYLANLTIYCLLGCYTKTLTHLLFGMNDSKAREKSRQLTGAVKHMILVRANLADNYVVPGFPRLAGEW